MKTAFISHLYPSRSFPAKGTFIRTQYRELSRKIDADMLVPSVRSLPFTKKWKLTHDPFLQDDKAERLRYLAFPHGRFPRIVRRSLSGSIVSRLKTEDYELVHVNWLFPDGLAIPAIRDHGYPVVLTIHGSDWYHYFDQPQSGKLVRDSLLQSDAVFTVGSRLRSDILQVYPSLGERIHISYNAVDFNAFTPPKSRDAALHKVGWDPDRNHLLCVANLTPVKGVDVLLEACEKIRTPNLTVHIIGNIPEMEYARKIATEINNRDNMVLHPPVGHDRIREYYQACDALVLPSRREGFGLSLAEAIACGKPVISTKSGGPEDIVTPENGYMIDIESPDQLAEKINLLFSGLENFDQEAVRDSIRNTFEAGQVTDSMIGVYEQLLYSHAPQTDSKL